MLLLNRNYIGFLLLILILISCTPSKKPGDQNTGMGRRIQLSLTSNDSAYTNDYQFIGDSILPGLKQVIQFYTIKYPVKGCLPLIWSKNDMRNAIEPPLLLGNIRKNVPSYVFVLPPFADCGQGSYFPDNGKSYYFSDTSLPKMSADVFCTHPSNIFLVGDIDEDGISEIGEYYSSCSSHYKSLRVWTLRHNSWLQVGSAVFDQHYMGYGRPFSSYVKKIWKGEFAIYEKTDMPTDSTKHRIGYWLKFKM
jgi:hypothetical protein